MQIKAEEKSRRMALEEEARKLEKEEQLKKEIEKAEKGLKFFKNFTKMINWMYKIEKELERIQIRKAELQAIKG